MLASLRGNAATAKHLKTVLLFEDPDSLAARYVLTTFANADAASKFLTDATESCLNDLKQVKPSNLIRAIYAAVAVHGQGVLESRTLVMIAATAADLAKDDQYETLLRSLRKLSTGVESLGLVLDTFNIRDIERRATTLFQLRKVHSDADLLMRFYLAQLEVNDQRSAALLHVRAQVLLDSHEFDRALPLLDRLIAKPPAKADVAAMKLWRGWALASTGKRDAAIAQLKQVATDHADSPWTKPAATLIACLQQFDERSAKAAETLARVFPGLRRNVEHIEAVIHFSNKHDHLKDEAVYNYKIYVGIAQGKTLHLHVAKDDHVILAYRATQYGIDLYRSSDQTTHKYPAVSKVPAPILDFTFNADASLSIEWNMRIVPLAEICDSLRSIADSPALTFEGLKTLAPALAKKGRFAGTIQRDDRDGKTTFQWVRPTLDATMETNRITVSHDMRITAIHVGPFEVNSMRYDAEEFELSPPTWPKSKTQEHKRSEQTAKQVGMALAMEFMGNAMKSMENEQP